MNTEKGLAFLRGGRRKEKPKNGKQKKKGTQGGRRKTEEEGKERGKRGTLSHLETGGGLQKNHNGKGI